MKEKFTKFLVLLFSLATLSTYAQQKRITGTVTAKSDGLPLPAVSVLVKGTSLGAQTDADGKYAINIPENATLVFSYVGFKTKEVKVGATSTINVALDSDEKQLGEVVVTALGISKEKKSLGYSSQSIGSKDLTEARETNVVNSLSGKIAGVQVTNNQGGMGASRIIIRGETSIAGNNQPLFVVDGVPIDNSQLGAPDQNGGVSYTNAAADINPEDVESMTVLKGPNAAALYGSRASAGVIVITTKSGKGKAQKGLGVSFNSNLTFENPLLLPSYQNAYGQGNGGEFSFVDGAGGGVNDGVDESWGPKLDAGLNIPQFFSNGQPAPWVSNPNNVKDFFETGHTYSNGFSVIGNTDKANFRFSYNNVSQKGIVPNTDVAKNTFALNGGVDLMKDLTLNASVNYVQTESENLPGIGYDAQNVMQQFVWFGRQVDISKLKNYKDAEGNKFNWNYNYHNNPYFTLNENLNGQLRNRVIGNVNANYKITNEFSVTARLGSDFYNDKHTTRIAATDVDNVAGSYSETAYYVNERNIDVFANYGRKLSADWSLDLMAGVNNRNKVYDLNYQFAPKLAVPGLYTLANSRDPLQSTSEKYKWLTYSAYGSASIGFRGYAFVNLTARNDWSSTLPSGNNSYFYPSVNGSLVITEAFKIQNNVLSFLKVRGGWAQVGKDGDPYLLANTYAFNNPFGSNPMLTVDNTYKNPNLKPEITKSTEFGLEARFFGNRLGFDVNHYNSDSYDQILAVDVTAAAGYTKKYMNAGLINNKGWEVMLTGNPVKTNSGFRWDVTLNWSKNDGKVVELDQEGNLTTYVRGGQWGLNVEARKGESYGTFYGTAFQRNDKGQILVDDDGYPMIDANKKVLGKYNPDWVGGISNSFTYKNVNLSFLIDTKQGGNVFSMTNSWGNYAGVLKETLPGREDGIVFNGVHTDGTPNTTKLSAEEYYKATHNNALNESDVYDASFIKLREFKIGYTFPTSIVSKLRLQALNLSLVGRNLWIIDKKVPNIDPETSFANGNAQGLEFGQLPTTRSIGFNLNVTF